MHVFVLVFLCAVCACVRVRACVCVCERVCACVRVCVSVTYSFSQKLFRSTSNKMPVHTLEFRSYLCFVISATVRRVSI